MVHDNTIRLFNQANPTDIRSFEATNISCIGCMDTPYSEEALFCHQGGQLQLDNSSVKLIVPQGTTLDGERITILAHVHVDLKKLHVLGLSDKEYIVSPAPEYHLTADWRKVIHKWMIIVVPLTLPNNYQKDNLIIYGFQSTEGKVKKYEIKEKSQLNTENVDDEMFYEIDDDTNGVRVSTFHFSGVVACYNCNKEMLIPGCLTARVYGSNILKANGREIEIRMEIWDKLKVKDFQTLVPDGLVELKRHRLTLPADRSSDTVLNCELSVTGDEHEIWQSKTTTGGYEIFPLDQKIEIKNLMICCYDPFTTTWVLRSTGNSPPESSFQCIISVWSDTDEERKRENTIYINSIPQTKNQTRTNYHKIIEISKETLTAEQKEELVGRCGAFHEAAVYRLERDKQGQPDSAFRDKRSEQVENTVGRRTHHDDARDIPSSSNSKPRARLWFMSSFRGFGSKFRSKRFGSRKSKNSKSSVPSSGYPELAMNSSSLNSDPRAMRLESKRHSSSGCHHRGITPISQTLNSEPQAMGLESEGLSCSGCHHRGIPPMSQTLDSEPRAMSLESEGLSCSGCHHRGIPPISQALNSEPKAMSLESERAASSSRFQAVANEVRRRKPCEYSDDSPHSKTVQTEATIEHTDVKQVVE